MFTQGMSIMEVPFKPSSEKPGKQTILIPGMLLLCTFKVRITSSHMRECEFMSGRTFDRLCVVIILEDVRRNIQTH